MHDTLRFRLLATVLIVATLLGACTSDGGTISLGDGTFSAAPDGDVEIDAPEAPMDFTYETFDDERMWFSDFPEGPVVLNFFASWCPPCIAEMPDFQTVSQDFAGQVNFLGLAVQDRPENAVALVADTGVTYAVGNDQNGDVFSAFGGLGMPTTVFINADHTVAKVHSGVLDAESLAEMITDELLP